MKAYLISDNSDTWVGMRLAGIKGVVAQDRDRALDEIKKASQDSEVGIILITERIARMAGDEVDRLKLDMNLPLIVEVPDRHGSMLEKDRITRYIKEAIGVKV